ncbi:MAG: iron ABC transporter substrate-binding protein, partial [Eubacteriales bacterium]|nr:iron ABC transporter substrate-binding protein [Eubacteriales bacterium]
MNKIKWNRLIGIVLTTVLLLSGCGSEAKESLPEVAKDAAESRTITDVYGRQIELPEKIETIAAIGGAARILTYAGCADKLIGVTDMDKENMSAMPYSVINAEHFASLVSVGSGGSNDTCYIEELVTLAPDVIFALMDEGTINNVADKTGIPTIGIYPDSMFDESLYSALGLIGEDMGTEAHCTQVIDYIKGCREDLDSRTKDIPDDQKPSVYTRAVSFRGAHAFEGTYADYPPFTVIH